MKRLSATVAVVALAASAVLAEDPTLAELQAQLKELSAKITKLEQQAAQKAEAPASDLAARVEKLENGPEIPDWVSNTKIKGDLRYRYENRDVDGAVGGNRQRIRGRIGVYGEVNDYIDYGVRFSMSEDATSSNNTLGDDFKKEGTYFDLFYADIHPEQFKGAHIIMGKMQQPWLARTGLLWDSDLNPEGIAVTYSKELGETTVFHANAGAFVVNDEDIAGDKGGDDVRLQTAQLAIDTKVGDTKLQAGASDYWFENMENATFSSWKNNTPNGGFNIIEGFGSATIDAGGLPLKFYGQVAQNTEAEVSNEDTAYLVGVKLGKAKDPGTWEIGYNWREVGKDSVCGPFNDGDFNNGNTDSKGHKIGAKYQISKNLQAGVTYLITEGVAEDSDTFQADMIFKF